MYYLALGTRYRAGIVHDAAYHLKDIIPHRTRFYTGEALFRFAEIVHLAVAYTPVEAPHGVLVAPVAETATYNRINALLDESEFRSVVAAHGALGYVRKPLLALRRMIRHFREYVNREPVRTVLQLGSTAAEIGGISPALQNISRVTEILAIDPAREYTPPFLPLGNARDDLYYAALLLARPSIEPPTGQLAHYHSGLPGGTAILSESAFSQIPPPALEERIAVTRACLEVQKSLFGSGGLTLV